MAENCDIISETQEEKGILINGIKYSYLISKSENEEESLIIKLYDSSKKSNIYFTYEASIQKLTKDIKFLSSCDNLDEMIISLNEVFSLGDTKVEEKHGIFNLDLKFTGSGISKTYMVQLTKHEQRELKSELEDKIFTLEKKYNNLYSKFEQIKSKKDNELRNIIKEVIFDKDIRIKLFEEMEQFLLAKYNLNDKNKNQDEKFGNGIIDNIQNKVEYKEGNINNEIINLQKQIKDNIEYLNNIKSNNTDNYIILQVNINEKNLNKDIRLFNQVSTYKYFCNFERDDIEVIIDDQIVNVNFKNQNDKFKYEYDRKSKNCELSQRLEYNLTTRYSYYWNFSIEGIHTVKIIFKKKLLKCNYLFYYCESIYKIDMSHFDCSQIINCSEMFYNCSSLTEINLGKLDFALSNNFSGMFYNCNNLEKVDVSCLNTQKSKSFSYMFKGCSKLKGINVSKFKSKNCENIEGMFFQCESLESVDMLNWNIENINKIAWLFFGCSKLISIKMNFNNKTECSKDLFIFGGLPDGGSFVWKKGLNCNRFLEFLPVSWNRTQE